MLLGTDAARWGSCENDWRRCQKQPTYIFTGGEHRLSPSQTQLNTHWDYSNTTIGLEIGIPEKTVFIRAENLTSAWRII